MAIWSDGEEGDNVFLKRNNESSRNKSKLWEHERIQSILVLQK